MRLIITSDTSVESSYPLSKKERPVPNLYLLGRRIIEREVNQAMESGLSDVAVIYRGAVELGESLPGGAYAYWPESASSTMDALSRHLSDIRDERVILQVGSHYAASRIHWFFLDKWNETGGALFTLLTPTPTKYTYGIGGLRASIDFQTSRVLKAEAGGEGYSVTGLVGGDRSTLVEQIKSSKDLLDLLLRALESSSIRAHIWPEEFVHLNEPMSFLVAIKVALKSYSAVTIRPGARVSPVSVIEGPVYIDEGAVIDHYAVIKGPVYVGRGSFIGSHTLIRSSVSIEPGGVVGSGAEVKRSYIGVGASIGSKCYIADSLIGDEALVRPFSITINYDPREARLPGFEKMGSIIGERSIVDSGAVLRPRAVIEPESFFTG